jgi:2-oxoglutarate dehydrogenase E1 component
MTFLNNMSPQWIEEQYLLWRDDPDRVAPEWRAFFAGFELAAAVPSGPVREELPDRSYYLKQSGVQSLIYRYRDIGHLMACTDPLSPCAISHPLLELPAFGLEPSDLDHTFHTRRFMKESCSLREILETLQETYCRSIGVEFMHIQEPAERQWLMDRMEPVRNRPAPSSDDQRSILQKLMEAALFEAFLQKKFQGKKRFSLEGGEALVPFLHRVGRHSARLGLQEMVMGMPHRGRLTVLATIFEKPLENIFAEFKDNLEDNFIGDGDVKYHKGFSIDAAFGEGTRMHLTLTSNPSHLEAVDPVVEGKTRAKQDRVGNGRGARILPLLIHGDAAFAGQGVVAETLNLSQLEGYRTGGTLHLILNNQIGFTTLPADARSTRYATDMAKMLMVPIFHVSGEDPEAVAWVAELAVDYRQTFGRDVIVEIICYRRYGHNEGDEPSFTQPVMYEKIRRRPPVHRLYAEKLQDKGIDDRAIREMEEEIEGQLESAFARRFRPVENGFGGVWSGIQRDYVATRIETGVPGALLRELAGRITTVPQEFQPHPKIAALLQKRRDAVQSGTGIDWGNAETLAYATLLHDGVPVRLSGQDSRRGAFSHRHSVLHDMRSDAVWTPLAGVAEGVPFHSWDSMLSEFAVLGFEYGYALESPERLVIWEAQFGDFANGAQVLIDQFIVSGETKWDRSCGLVLYLPHGYEGQGAEHSSARVERYLQLCAGNNIQVANPTTPAQFFHLLRRQMKQPFRKPLVVLTPKSLLRHPACVSRLDDLENGWYREIIAEMPAPASTKAALLCSGKIYYDLTGADESLRRADLAVIRLEQLYPLRTDRLRDLLLPLRDTAKIAWVQEEPRNMGAWSFVRPYLADILGYEPRYIGRDEDSSPAVGSHRQHNTEQERIVTEALQI